MDRLRPRKRNVFFGFTGPEIEKLEKLFAEKGKQSLDRAFCLKLATTFSRLAGRAGKPVVKWQDVQNWFENRQLTNPIKPTPPLVQPKEFTLPEVSKDSAAPDASEQKKQMPEVVEKIPDFPELKFEARSSRDGAWYDVERFLTHRFLSSGESEVRVKFVGFGSEEDEWVNVKNNVREIPLEDWECHKVKPGGVVLCLPAQNWLENQQLTGSLKSTPPTIQPKEPTPSPDVSKDFATSDASEHKKANEVPKAGEKIPDLSELEFEARSSKDGAWFDVERFLAHRFLISGESEVRVRFVGFGEEEDEWVSVKKNVRERSIPLEDWECHKVKTGDVMLCLQERNDQAMYYDAHIQKIESKMHDIRGCRCIFFTQYDHDKTEEEVSLRRLCRRP